MALGDGAGDTSLIVGAIAGERGEWTGDLIEQGPNLRAIIDLIGSQL
jgi:hypothetical protein